MWLTSGQMISARILERRQIIEVMRRRKDGPLSISLTAEARMALGMQEPQQVA